MNYNCLYLFLTILLSILHPLGTTCQEMVLVVERCKALDQTSPINNIWVDEDNVKWVSNKLGLHKVLALDLVQKVSIPSGTTSLLSIRGGNAKIEWNTSEMQNLLQQAVITSASYDPKTKSIWIGTQQRGAFQVSLTPLRILQQFNTDNRRLTSNQINDIFIQSNGTIWIATNDGMLTGSGDKWSLQERYLNFVGVDAWGSNMWILGDDFLWQVDSRGKWQPIAIELKNVEGPLRDIAVDDAGRVWIASNMMTGFDVNKNRYQQFGPGQYFTSQYVNCMKVDKDGSIWTGTDDKGLYLIQWEDAMTINILMDQPLDCKNVGPTAALSVKVTGGEPPFRYAWSSGQTTDKITNLAAGQYILSVTDSKGLVKSSKYEIPDASIELQVEIVTPASGSSQGDGSANLLVNGGSGEFVYAWDNGENQQTATRLTAGMHSVTVTDANGCSATTAFTVPEKLLPLSVSLKTIEENKCAYDQQAIIEAEIKGGKPPLRFQWSNGSEAQGKLTSLASGPYAVTIADAAGQTASAVITLTAPAPLILTTEMIASANVGVSNGQAQVKITGGKSPYQIMWESGETTAIVKTLSAGNHSISVTDALGCVVTSNVDIPENISTLGVIVKQVGQINCHNQSTASLQLDISGGKGPYTYLWSDGQSGTMAESLKAGEYQVTVTDVVGTKFTASTRISQPDPIRITTTADAAASTNGVDGKASVKATGGTGSYQFLWDNGETTNKATRLAAGEHMVTVTDAAGCASTSSVMISENILGLQASIEQTSTSRCAGMNEASLRAIARGGKEPFTYNWSNGATTPTLENLTDGSFQITITDAAGQVSSTVTTLNAPKPLTVTLKVDQPATANYKNGRASAAVTGGTGKYSYEWENGEKTFTAQALDGGQHFITVTDENGCTAIGSVMMTEDILPLDISMNQGNKISCAGQSTASLSAKVTGGKAPYVFLWKGPGKEWTGESIDQLQAGQYAVQVTDAVGASATSSFAVPEPALLELAIEQVSPATTGQSDGRVTLKVSGGTPDYLLNDTNWPSGKSSHTIDRLNPGNHLMTIRDAAGCSAQITVSITEDILPLSVKIEETQKILCSGRAEAALTTKVSGGKPPFVYQWSNGSEGSSLTQLQEGHYTLNVTDAAGQKTQDEFRITGPLKLMAEISNLRSATNDRLKDGKGNVEAKGGTGPYTYLWYNGETTTQAVRLPLGAGAVTVTDVHGCTSSAEFIIREKVLPELTAARLSSGEAIRMEKIQFDADSINIKPEAIPSLDELYEFLYDNPVIVIEVSGHTNSLPADDYCDRISAERATSVAQYLIQKGIEPRRVISKGYGKRKPIATNQTSEGRKRNQRVEIRLIRIEE